MYHVGGSDALYEVAWIVDTSRSSMSQSLQMQQVQCFSSLEIIPGSRV